MMVAMAGDEERFEPPPELRAWLDSLSPQERHAASDVLHGLWGALRRSAESLDHIVDLMLECKPSGAAAVDSLTGAALRAEGFRALARGDLERANELFDSVTEHYNPDPNSITITIIDPRRDE